MSEVDVAEFQALVAAALPTAFGGAVPAAVAELADPTRYGSMDRDASISFLFDVAADERPRVLITAMDDGGFMRDRMLARLPSAAQVLERWTHGEVQWILGANDEVTVLLGDVTARGDEDVPAGEKIVAVRVRLPSGEVEALTLHDAPPVDRMHPDLAARVAPLLERGAVGIWLCVWDAGQAVKVVWATEKPIALEALAIAREFVTGTLARATADVLESRGHIVWPIGVELDAAGGAQVSLWGLADPARAEITVPDLFFPGGLPDGGASLVHGVMPPASAFAEVLAGTVDPAHRDEVAAIAADRLVPGIVGTVPEGTDPVAHARQVWAWLYDKLAMQPPMDRIITLRVASHQLWVAAHEGIAFQLGLARYLHLHPDVRASDATLAPALRALSDDEIAARAEALLPAARAAEALFSSTPDLPAFLVPGVAQNALAVVDTLERAVSGSFVAAAGRLHEWLMEYGPGGYDDDPAAMGLDDIDLDAGLSQAAIEEALAEEDD